MITASMLDAPLPSACAEEVGADATSDDRARTIGILFTVNTPNLPVLPVCYLIISFLDGRKGEYRWQKSEILHEV